MSHHDKFSSISDDDFANQFQANVKSHNFVLPYASLLNSLFSNFLPDNPDRTADDDEETTLFPSDKTKYITSDRAFSFQQFEFNNHNFTALSLNIRSINNYKIFAKLEALLSSLNFSPTIISVSETWLRQSQSFYRPILPGYTFVTNSRSRHRGGGVGFFVHSKVKFSIRSDLHIGLMVEKIFESLCVDVQIGPKTLTCGTIYRSPSPNQDSHTSFMNLLTSTLTKIKQSSDCLLFGDFNYNILDTEDNLTSEFVDLMFEHAYFPVIKKPTRITSTNATLLDHIWTYVISSQSFKAGILTYDISDHLPVLLSLRLSSYSQAPGLKYRGCFSDTNISKFNASVESPDIIAVLNESDPNLSFKLFMCLYNTEFNKHFPLVRVKETKSFAPWFDTE